MAYGQNITDYLTAKNSSLSGVTYSADREYLLISHSRKNLWRSSFTAKFDIYNTRTGAFQTLQPVAGEQQELQLVRWAPVGNALAFVYGNDIYYVPSAANTAVNVRITNDGSSAIYNGHTDWVYEEEMFGSNNALWFSPNGSNLVFVRFDDTLVEEFTFPMYGEPGNRETVYPRPVTIRYPKSGRVNPTYGIFTVQLSAPTPQPLPLAYNGAEALRYYIASVQWADNENLLLITLDRPQTTAVTFRCPISTRSCASVLTQTETGGWIDVYTPRVSTTDETFMTVRYNTFGRQHIVRSTGQNAVGPISSGNYHVNSIIAWDQTNGRVYFSGTAFNATENRADASQTQIYFVDDSTSTDDAPSCITCSLLDVWNETCLSNSFSFSRDFTYVIHSCGGPKIPTTVLRKTSDWSLVMVFQNNTALKDALQNKQVPITRDYQVPVAPGYTANVRLILPSGFNESLKYPLFIDVYGGPGSKQIGQGFGVSWGTSLVSNRNIIYGLIDGRGSGGQTKDILFQLNRRLGTVEIDDQISAAKYMIDNYSFIDANRTAIWGWSYGGYATAMTMSKDTGGVYKCGISVAPVTNWLYYDTIYTERFMKLPTAADNWVNYNASDVTTHVDNFKTKNFFLVHGNADDNVHYQQSMILSRALEQNDIMFRQLSYPDENHGINGAGMRRHLYHSLEEFLFTDCFADMQRNDGGDTDNSSATYIRPSTAILTIIVSFILGFSFSA